MINNKAVAEAVQTLYNELKKVELETECELIGMHEEETEATATYYELDEAFYKKQEDLIKNTFNVSRLMEILGNWSASHLTQPLEDPDRLRPFEGEEYWRYLPF